MTHDITSSISKLDTLDLPIENGQVIWDELSDREIHQVIGGLVQYLDKKEAATPTDGVLDRALMLEETVRAITPVQLKYAGLLQDAFTTPKLRSTIDLPQGKTPFRDAKDLIAKTHGLRAYEASGRVKLASTLTPVRTTDTEREDSTQVGETQYPILGALQKQGKIHASKLSSAVHVLEAVDQAAEDAGKDQAFRQRLQEVVERDLADKIEHTTPEEFSRYASRRKRDVLISLDPEDRQFTDEQTQRMHNLWSEGPVRGNPNAYKWSLITDAEGNEALQTITAIANNPRAKQSEGSEDDEGEATSESSEVNDQEQIPDTRTRGQRAMHAVRDALKFALSRLQHSNLSGTAGNHTTMVVMADYSTLLQHLRNQLGQHLPEVDEQHRERLLHRLAEININDLNPSENGATPDAVDTGARPILRPKTMNLEEVLDDETLDRLQSRISQGIYTPHYPPETMLQLMCDVSVSPVILTGERQVLSIGRKQRAFPEHLRRAILARDRGCAVPGCHWPAAWCEIHHIRFWSKKGETSTDNGTALCGHHHQALHAKMLSIERVHGEIKFIQHKLIDATQQARHNLFWQN